MYNKIALHIAFTGHHNVKKALEGADGHRRAVTLTLTLDRVKVISACTIHMGLPAYLTM